MSAGGDAGKRRKGLIDAIATGDELTPLERGAVLDDLLRMALRRAGVDAEIRSTAQERDLREIVIDQSTRDHPNIALEFYSGQYKLATYAPGRIEPRKKYLDVSPSTVIDRVVADAVDWALGA